LGCCSMRVYKVILDNTTSYFTDNLTIPIVIADPGRFIQGDTKKRELLKFVAAAMYSWQHCGTGTLSYRQPRHSVIMDQCNGKL
jgi:hypothetical protein